MTDLQAVLSTPHVPEVKRTLAQVRPELAEDSLEFRAALLLLTGPMYAFNIDRLAGRTQVPRNVVAACARRLFDNGVWQPDGPVYTWRSPDEPQFWNDVGVAEGKLCRRVDRLGRIEWASAGAWRKAYEVANTAESLTILYSSQTPELQDEALALPTAPAERTEVRLPVRPRAERERDKAPATPAAAPNAMVPSGAPARTGKSDLFPGTDWLS